MDVVRKNVQALGGRIGIQSRDGVGSSFSLSLPLTLAVLDGMIVTVGEQTFVIPLSHIVESLRPTGETLNRFGLDGAAARRARRLCAGASRSPTISASPMRSATRPRRC